MSNDERNEHIRIEKRIVTRRENPNMTIHYVEDT